MQKHKDRSTSIKEKNHMLLPDARCTFGNKVINYNMEQNTYYHHLFVEITTQIIFKIVSEKLMDLKRKSVAAILSQLLKICFVSLFPALKASWQAKHVTSCLASWSVHGSSLTTNICVNYKQQGVKNHSRCINGKKLKRLLFFKVLKVHTSITPEEHTRHLNTRTKLTL